MPSVTATRPPSARGAYHTGYGFPSSWPTAHRPGQRSGRCREHRCSRPNIWSPNASPDRSQGDRSGQGQPPDGRIDAKPDTAAWITLVTAAISTHSNVGLAGGSIHINLVSLGRRTSRNPFISSGSTRLTRNPIARRDLPTRRARALIHHRLGHHMVAAFQGHERDRRR